MLLASLDLASAVRCPNGPDVLPATGVNFDQCQFKTVMCCWDTKVRQDGSLTKQADNTDVCSVDGNTAGFQGKAEGPIHCHGFTWSDESPKQIQDLLHFVNQTDHFCKRGYFHGVGGKPDCGCIENMPLVSRSDCTQLNGQGKNGKSKFTACKAGKGNDLKAQVQATDPNNPVITQKINLVGRCPRGQAAAGGTAKTPKAVQTAPATPPDVAVGAGGASSQPQTVAPDAGAGATANAGAQGQTAPDAGAGTPA